MAPKMRQTTLSFGRVAALPDHRSEGAVVVAGPVEAPRQPFIGPMPPPLKKQRRNPGPFSQEQELRQAIVCCVKDPCIQDRVYPQLGGLGNLGPGPVSGMECYAPIQSARLCITGAAFG